MMVFAACYRSEHLVLVVTRNGTLYDWRRHRVRARNRERIGRLIDAMASDHRLASVVVEARLRRKVPQPLRANGLEFERAAHVVLRRPVTRQAELFCHLIETRRDLRPLVALPKKPGGRRPWQAAFLIAAALAQAWEVLAGRGID